jgi:hypothetical protein
MIDNDARTRAGDEATYLKLNKYFMDLLLAPIDHVKRV